MRRTNRSGELSFMDLMFIFLITLHISFEVGGIDEKVERLTKIVEAQHIQLQQQIKANR